MTRNRKLKIAGAFAAVALASALYCKQAARPHVSDIFTTRRTSGPAITWRTMEMAWRHEFSSSGNPSEVVDFKADTSGVYTCTADDILTKLDVQTGGVVWHRNLHNPGSESDVSWSTLAAPGNVLAYPSEGCCGSPAHSPTIYCLRSTDGQVQWQAALDVAMASDPVVSGSRVLIPLMTGEVACFGLSSGSKLWRRQISVTHFDPDKDERDGDRISLSADANRCVACIGEQHFVAFDSATGESIWSRTIFGTIRHAEKIGGSATFALSGERLYISATKYKSQAWSALTGATLWRRTLHAPDQQSNQGAPGDAPIVLRDTVLVDFGNDYAALNRSDGTCKWVSMRTRDQWGTSLNSVYRDLADSASRTLYVFGKTYPVINRVQRKCNDLLVSSVVAINAETGLEKWRWQNDLEDGLDQVIPVADGLLCNCQNLILEMRPGPEEAIPRSRGGRTELAYRMIEDLTSWNPRRTSPITRLLKKIPMFTQQPNAQLVPSRTHAMLCLLRLGNESVPALLDLVSHEIGEIDSKQRAVTGARFGQSIGAEWDISDTLVLLDDLRARKAEPELIKHLEATKSARVRRLLAELLIRLDLPTSMPALFNYVKHCGDEESVGAEETLAYLCRNAPRARLGATGEVTQDTLRSYLETGWRNAHEQNWHRRFALFELMRSGTDADRKLALSFYSTDSTAPLMPTLIQATGAQNYWYAGRRKNWSPTVKTRDNTGAWWGAFNCNYFGSQDVWIVQSKDGANWERPTPAFRGFGTYGLPVALSCVMRSGLRRLQLKYRSPGLAKTLSLEVSLDDAYRDFDGDGVPDLVENEIGTNPARRDSWNTGFSDGNNKNPLYRPHSLTREEQIYQALIEAICLYARQPGFVPGFNSEWPEYEPVDSAMPLFLPPGPSGAAVPVYNHQHTVFMSANARSSQQVGWNSGSYSVDFTLPETDFNGKLNARPDAAEPPMDMWQPGAKSRAFDRSFPCMKDGNRVRVGIFYAGSGFDVEVDRFGDRWLPVECRLTGQMFRNRRWSAAAPQ